MTRPGTMVAIGALMLGLLTSCQEPQRWVRTVRIDGPPGGSALALAHGSGGAIHTISTQQIYERTQTRWQPLDVTWKAPTLSTQDVLGSFARYAGVATASGHDRFVRHRQTLWLLSQRQNSLQHALYVSRDEARTWQEVALPAQLTARSARLNASTAPRLSTSSAGLFLIGGQNIWRIQISADSVDARSQRVSLRGVSMGRSSLTQGLPLTLRHYVPADAQRPYDVLSVLGDQLFVYRRPQGQDTWTLISTLNTIDLDIAALPNRAELMMVTPKGLLLGEDQAEQWTRHNIPMLSKDETVTRILYKPLGAQVDSQVGVFVAGTSSGSIYVSDQTFEWRQTRPSDPSHRGITDLLAETQTASIWASTQGQGLLRSQDAGQTWTSQNAGFLSASLRVGLSRPEGTYWGTDAGLFRFNNQQWSPLVDYNTSALAQSKSRELLAGTTHGQILRIQGNAVLETRSPDYQNVKDGPRFEPHTRWTHALPSKAILSLFETQGTMHVMTHGKGRLAIGSDAKIEALEDTAKVVLEEALQGARITSVVDVEGVLLFSTQGVFADIPTQLWRSYDQGKTWRAIVSLEQGNVSRTTRLFLRQNKPYVIHQGVLYRLLMDQATLQKVDVPWSDVESILDYVTTPEQDVALTFSNRTLKVHKMSPDLSLRESFELRWEEPAQGAVSKPWFVVPQEDVLLLSDGDALYQVDLTRTNQNSDQGFPLMLSILAIVLTASVGFGLFKRYE